MGKLYLALCFATVLLVSLPGICGLDAAPARVIGEKLDSGAGTLPHYREWGRHPSLLGLVRPVRGSGGQRDPRLAEPRVATAAR